MKNVITTGRFNHLKPNMSAQPKTGKPKIGKVVAAFKGKERRVKRAFVFEGSLSESDGGCEPIGGDGGVSLEIGLSELRDIYGMLNDRRGKYVTFNHAFSGMVSEDAKFKVLVKDGGSLYDAEGLVSGQRQIVAKDVTTRFTKDFELEVYKDGVRATRMNVMLRADRRPNEVLICRLSVRGNPTSLISGHNAFALEVSNGEGYSKPYPLAMMRIPLMVLSSMLKKMGNFRWSGKALRSIKDGNFKLKEAEFAFYLKLDSKEEDVTREQVLAVLENLYALPMLSLKKEGNRRIVERLSVASLMGLKAQAYESDSSRDLSGLMLRMKKGKRAISLTMYLKDVEIADKQKIHRPGLEDLIRVDVRGNEGMIMDLIQAADLEVGPNGPNARLVSDAITILDSRPGRFVGWLKRRVMDRWFGFSLLCQPPEDSTALVKRTLSGDRNSERVAKKFFSDGRLCLYDIIRNEVKSPNRAVAIRSALENAGVPLSLTAEALEVSASASMLGIRSREERNQLQSDVNNGNLEAIGKAVIRGKEQRNELLNSTRRALSNLGSTSTPVQRLR